jgi:para-nitrobenzyl esterase
MGSGPGGWLGSVAIAAALGTACGDDTAADPLQIELDSGVIRGVRQGATRMFRGIPYAAPPVGDLRWRSPQPVTPWGDVRLAAELGASCPQGANPFGGGGLSGDEDCLYLNVWTPAQAQSVPVLVWLHGGAFMIGTGGETYYAGRHLAETYGVAVVTINYRIGPLGFLAHPALTAESFEHPSSGNYGIEDQLAALRWVQRNIRAFGGDPGRVTLFGESAGGLSACVHYVSPASAGLFHAAIAQSGLCTNDLLMPPLAEAETHGVALAEQLGCPGVDASAAACLRGASPEQLVTLGGLPAPASLPPGGQLYAAAQALPATPNVDGLVIPARLHDAFAAGNYPARPLVIGNTRDEGTLFHNEIASVPVDDDDAYRAALERRFGAGAVDAIVAQYPPASYASRDRALAEITTDAFWVCPARRAARGAAMRGAKVYAYSFERELQNTFLPGLGVFHASELPFVFGTDPLFPLGQVGEAGRPAAAAIQQFWTRFAATGEPGGGWPVYTADDDTLMVIDVDSAPRTGHKAAVCDFWDAL